MGEQLPKFPLNFLFDLASYNNQFKHIVDCRSKNSCPPLMSNGAYVFISFKSKLSRERERELAMMDAIINN